MCCCVIWYTRLVKKHGTKCLFTFYAGELKWWLFCCRLSDKCASQRILKFGQYWLGKDKDENLHSALFILDSRCVFEYVVLFHCQVCCRCWHYRMATNSQTQLSGTLMILKAACMNNPSYIDRLITSFMRVLQRLAREHLTPTTPPDPSYGSDLLILSLDLVKNRVGVMTPDMRKAFIGTILVGLIDKTQDAKVMKAIMKMVEEWVKTKVCWSCALIRACFLLLNVSLHLVSFIF